MPKFFKNHFSSNIILAIFIAIILLALFFRFWDLGQADLIGDDGHYAFRAYGWLDYLGGNQQTAPIQWFGRIPWWGYLSFHDHPPMGFVFQFVSFWLFGPSAMAARFLITLLCFFSVIIFYFLIKKFKDEPTALLAAFLYAISTYAVWISRQSLNDGLVLGFEICFLYFFINYLSTGKKHFLPLAASFIGLALLSKYTAAFLLPAALAYLLIYRRDVLKTKEFQFAFISMFFILTPIIIYNFNVLISRGHFDATLSHMIGLRPADFEIIKNRVVNFNLVNNAKSEIVSVYLFSSFSYLILKLFGLIYLLLKFIRRKCVEFEKIIVFILLFVISMFLFMGPAPRYFSIVEPFLIISLSIFIFDLFRYLKNNNFIIISYCLGLFIAAIFIFEMFFSINSNLFVNPIGQANLHFAAQRQYNAGLNQLDDFITAKIYPDAAKYHIFKYADLTLYPDQLKNKSVIIYDDRISWYATIWIFTRHLIYEQQPIFSLNQIFQIWKNPDDSVANLKEFGVKDFWFITAVSEKTFDTNMLNQAKYDNMIKEIESNFKKVNIEYIEILDRSGNLAFKIYHFE